MPVQAAHDLEISKAAAGLLTMQHQEKQHKDPGSSSQISPSVSLFSPSPYIINCKRRACGGWDTIAGAAWEGKSREEVFADAVQDQERFVVNPDQPGTCRISSLNDQLVELKDALEKFISECSSSRPQISREEERGSLDGGGATAGVDFQALRRRNVRGKILAEILSSRKLTSMKPEIDELSTTTPKAEDDCRSSSGSPCDEFFDARDASSSEGYSSNEDGSTRRHRKQISSSPIDPELVRQLHMEVKRRMQAEEALHIMEQCQENIVSILLSPVCPTPPRSSSPQPVSSAATINNGLASLIEEDWQDENSFRTVIATVISSALLRGVIRPDEAEALEKLLETKDRESFRLRRKLKFFEHVNNELSRKNQEATERARRIRRSRQKWLSVSAKCLAVGVAIGVSGTLLYWYFPWDRLKSAKKEVEAPPAQT
ncbi:uncharacterized protein LOC112350553 isoform X1 [Selaginella moellendorffii]|uniref:uncharacterized protein LOC112350553 isoform X1 n=1 Tax=Selaginella moellendorffii TaxID=88036 RepID=UPI000D1CA4AA|nr:uncharacterized protein LOC112350553 isoform X1 [Selaginella moellendorffii]|eukprot:XP_024542668.1 uncharacterized protein LOC112350553 isoform X1 [Selaginella moellendorffii]